MLGNHFIGDEPEITYLWQNQVQPAQGYSLNLAIFVRQKDETYLRIGEQQRQYAHSAQLLTELMEAVGFTDIRLYGDKKALSAGTSRRALVSGGAALTEEAPPTVGERMTEVPQAPADKRKKETHMEQKDQLLHITLMDGMVRGLLLTATHTVAEAAAIHLTFSPGGHGSPGPYADGHRHDGRDTQRRTRPA